MLSDLRAWAPDLWAGVQLTVFLTCGSMALALVLGLLLALARISPSRALRLPTVLFVELVAAQRPLRGGVWEALHKAA